MPNPDPRIVQLVEDEFSSAPTSTPDDRQWMITAAQDGYMATVAIAMEKLQLESLPPDVDEICLQVGFLRGFRAFIRYKSGLPWTVARGRLS